MCDPVTAGLVLTAVGGGTSYINEQNALKRQDRQAAEGIRRQGELSRKSNMRVNDQVQDIAGSTGEAERAQSLEGFLNALRQSDESATGGLPGVAGANARYAEDVEAGRSKVRTEGTERAGRLSRIDAPLYQRMNEGHRVGRTAQDVGELGRQSTAEDYLTRLRVAAEQPNALIGALAKTLQGVGSGLTMGAGGVANMGAPNLSKLYKAGSLISSPTVPTGMPFSMVS